MFDQSAFMLQMLSDNGLGRIDDHGQARKQGNKQFWVMYMRGQLARFWARFTGQNYELDSLAGHKNRPGRYAGVQTVLLAQIKGSEGRSHDFDARFHPLQRHDQNRWAGVAAAMQSEVVMPPVHLIQVGDRYFVRDGHHRISVAAMLGQVAIDAQVTVWEI